MGRSATSHSCSDQSSQTSTMSTPDMRPCSFATNGPTHAKSSRHNTWFTPRNRWSTSESTKSMTTSKSEPSLTSSPTLARALINISTPVLKTCLTLLKCSNKIILRNSSEKSEVALPRSSRTPSRTLQHVLRLIKACLNPLSLESEKESWSTRTTHSFPSSVEKSMPGLKLMPDSPQRRKVSSFN